MTDINWNEIKEKYPKGYEKFKYSCYPTDLKDSEFWIDNDRDDNPIIYYDGKEERSYIQLPLYLYYGLLEKFFDDNGIIIDIYYKFNFHFSYTIYYKNSMVFKSYFEDKTTYKRNEAKPAAIFKAFEILEKELIK
jgi:hypothetical protein